jgi:hypothetical protein
MPSNETVERFIARVELNAHIEAIEEYYAENSSMQENQGTPRVGRQNHIASERKFLVQAKKMVSQCVRPVFINGDHVVIRWMFRFDWHDGTTTHIDEIAYQRWIGERIIQENFYYDPGQRMRIKTT